MYIEFFKLSQAPFSIAPDPRYLFMSERHREALAHLLYGVNSGGGFVLLTGEIGAGKTTVCRCFLEQIPAKCNVAYIFNPKLTVEELLRTICIEFGISVGDERESVSTIKDYVDLLNEYLLATHADGQNNVLIIDEAQNLSAEVLEQLRLLTNLETNERKLLQIILIGQPELRDMLATPGLEQLAQRVIARYHLESLSLSETARYIQHRLAVSGLSGNTPFRPREMRAVHRLTQGVPRRINLLCDRALLGAYVENKSTVDRSILRKAAAEIFDTGQPDQTSVRQPWRYALLGAATGLVVAGGIVWGIGKGFPGAPISGGKVAATVNAHPAASNIAHSASDRAFAAPVSLPGVPDNASVAPTDVSLARNQTGTINTGSTPFTPATDVFATSVSVNSRNRNLAYRQLALLWNTVLPEGDPCRAALKKDLRCYKASSGLAEIRELDRPALLALNDDNNKAFYALLMGLSQDSALLRIGATTGSVSLAALGRHMRGDFATFWRMPQSYRDHLGAGDRGADVDWLASVLAELAGAKHPEPNLTFDANIARSLREYQAAQGLRIDGVAGPQTFMRATRSAGIDEPHLQTGPFETGSAPGK